MMQEFNCQNVSNTVWALATMGRADVPFLDSMAAQALARLIEADAQDLSNTAWAFSVLEVTYSPMIHAISSAAMRMIRDLPPLPFGGSP